MPNKDSTNKCSSCGSSHTKVVDNRPQVFGYTRRRRQCTSCGARSTTYEIPAATFELLIGEKDPNLG